MNNVYQVPQMLPIKEVCYKTGLSYCYIRSLCLQNKIIHVRAGNKYLINFQRLCDYLNNGGVNENGMQKDQ